MKASLSEFRFTPSTLPDGAPKKIREAYLAALIITHSCHRQLDEKPSELVSAYLNCSKPYASELLDLAVDEGLISFTKEKMAEFTRRERRNLNLTDYAAIAERDGGFFCKGCGSKEKLCIDHIIPVSKGGGPELSNLQILCEKCNLKKGSKIIKRPTTINKSSGDAKE